MALVVSPPSESTRDPGVLSGIAAYWHLFSFDAPTVAALWSWSFAKVAHVELPFLAPLLLATGTWLIYVVDRILDGLGGTKQDDLRLRHYFYSQHRASFLFAAAAVCPVFAWAVLTRMSPVARVEDSAVFVFAAVYFFLVHVHDRHVRQWLPKELAVGMLFAAATAVPTWSRTSGNTRLSLIPFVALFAILCWLNCVAIEIWEHSSQRKELVHRTTLWAGRNFSTIVQGTAVLAFAFTLINIHDPARCSLGLASGLAGLLLQWLAHRRPYLSAMQFRIAVDAVLLTPLLFMAWMR